MEERSTILDEIEIERILKRLAYEIFEKNKGFKNICLIGIKSRGVPMANFITKFLGNTENVKIPVGILDITFYRDDLSKVADKPVFNSSELNLNIEDKIIILVDDVLYTGKTVHVATIFLLKQGKPESIQLCVLIDRGHHKLPISADFVGKVVPTKCNEVIKVNLKEIDNQENVKIFLN
ncbi:MAG: bifunctional pyr operon transcriptional regulator/uracil phosphoribosyltransferase PyrR [Candidatus Cloacimonetes bacterium]|nr:bifunctional pyr operon transcriptional regulator/uracil phosphoribosyltransferase PyrR [Candidatus Cloacimonadota bacterium]